MYVQRNLGIGTIPESPLRVFGIRLLLHQVEIPKQRRAIPESSVRVLGIGTILKFLKKKKKKKKKKNRLTHYQNIFILCF